MRTLTLLRHAKSSWDDLSLPDHDRPLGPRGRRACATLSNYLRERKGGPPALDLILCSTAVRARETLDGVLEAWTVPPPVEFEDGLYLCGEEALMARVRRLDDRLTSVMLVGHNPDFAHLTLRLCGGGDLVDLHAIEEKLPTGSFVVIELPDTPWASVAWRSGRLAEFTYPRKLAGDEGSED